MLVRIVDNQLGGAPAAEPLYRLIPALRELAALYHERWESEVHFTEIKVTLRGRLMLRSRRPI